MKMILMTGIAATAALAQPASATLLPKAPVPTIIYTPGSYAMPTWTTAKIFQNFQTASTTTAYSPVRSKGEVVTGQVDVDNGLAFGAASASRNNFLSITSGNTYGIKFTQPMQVFSFSLYSLNTSDKLSLNFANGSSLSLLGAQIIGATGTRLLDSSGRVSFDLGGQSGIVSAVFSSTSDCAPFRIDNLASAAPEPGTWAMMIVGFGMAGAALRRRRRVAVRVCYAA